MKVMSWNVNGIRSAWKQGFLDVIRASEAEVWLLQEVRAEPAQIPVPELEELGYRCTWHPAEKKGYSGVAVLSKFDVRPEDIVLGLGAPEFDAEGRFVAVKKDGLLFASVYFPNSQREGARLPFKLDFCNFCLKRMNEFREAGFGIVMAGDFNIAHEPIDLANPKQNEKNAGYLPAERAWFSSLVAAGYLDAFRLFEKGNGHYTWWRNFPPSVRARNVGWRLDYHVVSGDLRNRVKSSRIHADILGSDHCPVSLELR